MPLGMGRGQNVGLRDFKFAATCGICVDFHKHILLNLNASSFTVFLPNKDLRLFLSALNLSTFVHDSLCLILFPDRPGIKRAKYSLYSIISFHKVYTLL